MTCDATNFWHENSTLAANSLSPGTGHFVKRTGNPRIKSGMPGVGVLISSFKADCDAVARVIAPADTPHWLTNYLVHWSTPLASERSVTLLHPTKTDMKEKLSSIGNAADALNVLLSDPMPTAFLEREFHFEIDKEFAGFRTALPLIAARAHRAARSPALSKQSGKTKSGRGKALLPGTYNPKIFCALVIAEAWKFIHGSIRRR